VQELEVLPRGLAHPIVFAGPDALTEAGRIGGVVSDGDAEKQRQGDGRGAASFSSLLSTYGAVPVNGKNMHKLLAQGEVVLLYPGGAREVRRAPPPYSRQPNPSTLGISNHLGSHLGNQRCWAGGCSCCSVMCCFAVARSFVGHCEALIFSPLLFNGRLSVKCFPCCAGI